MKGLYYYKLSSPYKEDQTKQCRLNINEIDSNFLNLKDADIANAELDNETKAIILTKNDGDKFVIDLKPLFDGSIYDLEVSRETPTENGGGINVLIKYNTLTEDGEKVPTSVSLNNLVTVDMLKHGITNKVYTDGTITGDGTIEKPLAIASTERQIPAEALIDAIKGEKLPETPAVGQRYITKEYISDYGYLYNYDTAKEIQKSLDEDGFGWRIPTKEDWDCLLNSIEPCDYQDHNSTKCHIFLGKYAGKKLKSACGWEGEPDCECKNTIPSADKVCKDNDDESDDETPIEVNENAGTDEYNMSILPAGYADEKGRQFEFGETASFWTSTHVYNDENQDLYVKIFNYNKSGVIQEAQCTGDRNSIRLVKDFTGNNYHDAEMIDGSTYKTILFNSCNLIWTSSNFANSEYQHDEISALTESYGKIAYFINDWDGKKWVKKLLKEGESVIIKEENENCQSNIEYTVFTGDNCNQALVNSDNAITERVITIISEKIDKETEERKEADEKLKESIENEIKDRETADELLQEEIEAETNRAQEVEQQIWDAVNTNKEDADQTFQQVWRSIEDETNRAQSVESQLWDGVNGETNRAQEVEQQIWDGLASESEAREKTDNEQWTAINGEIERAQSVESQLWDGINGETNRAQEVEQQIWDSIGLTNSKIDEEINRAKTEEKRIEGEIPDGSSEVIARLNGGVIIPSKEPGANDITINIDADFGTF